jgi:hypothetical protein
LSVFKLQTIPFVVPFAETLGVGLYVPAVWLEVEVGVLEVNATLAYPNDLSLSPFAQI